MTEYYPGSKMKPKTYDYTELPETEESLVTLGNPRIYAVGGRETEFYTIGELSRSLNRKPVTIRKWESDGIIPKSSYIAPSSDKRGKRRLYTRAQILGLKEIAKEEGVLEPNARGAWKAITETNFREKSLKLFKDLMENSK